MLTALLFVVAPVFILQEPDSLREIERRRALDPFDPVVLCEYAALLHGEGDLDGELAYLICALDAYDHLETEDDKQKERALRAVERKIRTLDEGSARLRSTRGRYVQALMKVFKLYANNQKKYRNALDIASLTPLGSG